MRTNVVVARSACARLSRNVRAGGASVALPVAKLADSGSEITTPRASSTNAIALLALAATTGATTSRTDGVAGDGAPASATGSSRTMAGGAAISGSGVRAAAYVVAKQASR